MKDNASFLSFLEIIQLQRNDWSVNCTVHFLRPTGSVNLSDTGFAEACKVSAKALLWIEGSTPMHLAINCTPQGTPPPHSGIPGDGVWGFDQDGESNPGA